MCLRGEKEEYINANTTWYKGFPQPHETEAMGLKEAIRGLVIWVYLRCLLNLIVIKWLTTFLAISIPIPCLNQFLIFAKIYLNFSKTLK